MRRPLEELAAAPLLLFSSKISDSLPALHRSATPNPALRKGARAAASSASKTRRAIEFCGDRLYVTRGLEGSKWKFLLRSDDLEVVSNPIFLGPAVNFRGGHRNDILRRRPVHSCYDTFTSAALASFKPCRNQS